ALVKIYYVFIGQTDAAIRYRRAYQPRFVRAVDSEHGVAPVAVEIESARAERIVLSAGDASRIFRQMRLAPNHVGCRGPRRPFRFAADLGPAFEGKPLLADGDAIARGLTAFLDEIKETLRRIDDDRPGGLAAVIADTLPSEAGVQGETR